MAKVLIVAADCEIEKFPLVTAFAGGRDKAVPLLNESRKNVKFVGCRRQKKKEASRLSSRL
jgi:hypothetical protein